MSFEFDYSCLPIGIGSLPGTAPREATEFIFDKFWEIPHWAQLPKAGAEEGFVNQFIGPLTKLGLVTVEGTKVFFDTDAEDWAAKLGEFYAIYLEAVEGDEKALQFFAFPKESASGYYDFLEYLHGGGTRRAQCLKGQISGPLSVGFTLTDQNRRAAYYDPQIRDILIKVLSMQGKLQARELGQFELPVLIFVDDPGLYAYGMSTHVTLKREEIIGELNTIFEQIKGMGASVGVHCCGGMDWTLLMESNLQVISFDAFEYFTSIAGYTGELNQYLSRGGILAWGIVPTSEKLRDETAESLTKLFIERINTMEKKGLDRKRLLKQAFITPSCGTGILPDDLAEKVYDTTRKVSDAVRKNMHL